MSARLVLANLWELTWMSGWAHHALNDNCGSLRLNCANNAAYVEGPFFFLKSEILAHARQTAALNKNPGLGVTDEPHW